MYQSLGTPAPRTQYQKKMTSTQMRPKNMLYIPWMILQVLTVPKMICFENFRFSRAQGEKLQEQVVYQSLGTRDSRNQYQNTMTNT